MTSSEIRTASEIDFPNSEKRNRNSYSGGADVNSDQNVANLAEAAKV